MPAFTFEKISPPIRHSAPTEPHQPNKPRRMIVRILDRFVESRGKRSLHEEKAVIPVTEER